MPIPIPKAELTRERSPQGLKKHIEELNRRIVLNPYSDPEEDTQYDEYDPQEDEVNSKNEELEEFFTAPPDAPDAPKVVIHRASDWFIYTMLGCFCGVVVGHIIATGTV